MEFSRRKVLIGAGAMLALGAIPELAQADKKPVPPIPDSVRQQGSEAIVRWLLDGDHLTPENLQNIIGEKARAAAEVANPLLGKLRLDFERLEDDFFKAGPKPKWEKVAEKLTPDVLKKAGYLENPRMYGVNRHGELLIGDGEKEVPSFTLRQKYQQVRSGALAQGLSLWSEDDYMDRRASDYCTEFETVTWLESGDMPSRALLGNWVGRATVNSNDPERTNDPELSADFVGARRVLRVKL